MNINHQTQAILLLTAYFGKPAKGDPKPLTPSEWGRFAQWLRENAVHPEALLFNDPVSLLKEWRDHTITIDRINFLLNRAATLGLALEKWERSGLWILTRSDPYYPTRLKRLLKSESPAILFGCGNQCLLNQGGIAIVGSRHADEQDTTFTSTLGGEAALQGLSIVSGGARGIDEAAMLGALEHEGTVIGVLGDSLLRAATSAKYRNGLISGNLVLVSPFNPEAGFDVGNAMSRNKYIYCLADAAIVVSTSKGKGGTWNGAIENLKARWVPLWVKNHHAKDSGNAALVQQGAQWLPENPVQFSTLFSETVYQKSDVLATDLSEMQDSIATELTKAPIREAPQLNEVVEQQTEIITVETQQQDTPTPHTLSFYDLFLYHLEHLTTEVPATIEQLSESMDLHKSQLNDWLKRAIAEGYIDKLSKPVRYQWVSFQVEQSSLLNEAEGIKKAEIAAEI
jgi:predicted Rossmann fold nucleotide-binding protein DprA/Smf involved in DNA uptake